MVLKSLLVLCLLLSISTSAYGKERTSDKTDYYSLLSSDGWLMRWSKEKFPLRVFIDDGSQTPGYRPQFRNILMSAFYSWSDAAGGKLSFTKCLSPKDADIVCTWTKTYKDEPEMPPGRPNAGASFYEDFEEAGTGHINIKKVHISIPVSRPTDGLTVTNEEMKCTCLHEIGHALGIDIHSPDSSDMMCRFNNAFKVKPVLSKRDVHTIQRLYSSFD